MKYIRISNIIFLIIMIFSFSFIPVFAGEFVVADNITVNGITIDGISSNKAYKKPKIMFYIVSPNKYNTYLVEAKDGEVKEIILKNKTIDLEKTPVLKNGEYYIDDIALGFNKEVKEIKLIDETTTKIVSATLNGEKIVTDTTLNYLYDNGDYEIVIKDSDGHIAKVSFILDNDSYLVEVTKSLLKGTLITVELFFITLVLSIPLGLLGASLKRIKFLPFKKLRKSKNKILRGFSKFNPLRGLLDLYTWVIRGTPLLLQLFVFNFGIPILLGKQYNLGPFPAAVLTFVINYTAYFIEIFRGGMESISKGQFEACKVMGLNHFQSYTRIILPQTFKKVIPSITNESITLVKDTALVSAIAITDLLFNTNSKVSKDFRLDAYFVAGAIYLLLTLCVVLVFRKIEKKYSYYN